jgi:hypothetical protein
VKTLVRWIGRALAALALATLALIVVGWTVFVRMPGSSYAGPLPPPTDVERTLASELRRHVEALASDIGERNAQHPEALEAAAAYVARELEAAGYAPARHEYEAYGRTFANVEAELEGADEIVIIGAHYDSERGTPGADDNASGVAAMLALARATKGNELSRTVRFVAFANEEQPHFQTPAMGSWQYAKRSRARGERIVAMLSLESMGYYSDEPGSQHYPPPLSFVYPSEGNFIGFVGNVRSRKLVRRAVASFRDAVRFPSEGAALPEAVPGVGWSDHWAFWQEGYPAIMVTGTAPYRNPHYHRATDTPDTLDYERLARVVIGLEAVIDELAGRGPVAAGR